MAMCRDRGAPIMSTSFQEFLKEKAEVSGARDRKRSREEWLGALTRLFDQIRTWLNESDPEHLIEVVPFEVERVEQRLGVYDAPALKIRLGTDSIDIRTVGRYTSATFSLPTSETKIGRARDWGDLGGGRVDVTDGERKYLLLRVIEDGQDRWYAWGDKM